MKLAFTRIILLSFFCLCALFTEKATAQNTLTLDKKGKVKRLHYFAQDHIKLQLINGEKIAGTIDFIYDTAFVIDGRVIIPGEVYQVYTERTALKWLGGLCVTGGLFYLGIEVINNAINDRGYAISSAVAAPVFITLGAGATMLLFSTRKTKVVGTNKFKILNTSPIPIQE